MYNAFLFEMVLFCNYIIILLVLHNRLLYRVNIAGIGIIYKKLNLIVVIFIRELLLVTT